MNLPDRPCPRCGTLGAARARAAVALAEVLMLPLVMQGLTDNLEHSGVVVRPNIAGLFAEYARTSRACREAAYVAALRAAGSDE